MACEKCDIEGGIDDHDPDWDGHSMPGESCIICKGVVACIDKCPCGVFVCAGNSGTCSDQHYESAAHVQRKSAVSA